MLQNNEEERIASKIEKYERCFSARNYRGRLFKKEIGHKSGDLALTIMTLNSVTASKGTEYGHVSKYTGGFARAIAHATNANAIFYQRKKADVDDKNNDRIKKILDRTEVIIILNSHCNQGDKDSTLKICAESDFNKKEFLENLLRLTFEYTFNRFEGFVCAEDSLKESNSISKYDWQGKGIIYLDFEISDFLSHKQQYLLAMTRIINTLKNLDWDAEKYDVYRLWQTDAKSQIPQDKAEVILHGDSTFQKNSLVHLRSFEDENETARIHDAPEKANENLNKFLTDGKHQINPNCFIFLTNRMIENLFNREWLENNEDSPGLFGAPVVVYENKKETYYIGKPKATQVNEVSLSTSLYKEKKKLFPKYDFIIFNKYTDTRMFIKTEDADYKDYGRVNGQKVMLPRYYRLMLGYLDMPLKTIRQEEYDRFYSNLPKTIKVKQSEKIVVSKGDFDKLYSKVQGRPYYQLNQRSIEEFPDESQRVQQYLDDIGAYSSIDLIRVPKEHIKINNSKKKTIELLEMFEMWILKKTIGKAEYILKTQGADDTDDKNNVARLNNNMMKLLGVSENDKILIKFGKSAVTLRVLNDDKISDYEIKIPASGRRDLGMSSINDIVIVHRDMKHTFHRHSQEQTIAILGTVLAVVQVITAIPFFTTTCSGVVLGILICLIAIVGMLYFALNEERVKVK